jgi:hypothetical protein
MANAFRISSIHRKGTNVFVVDGNLNDEIAERGGFPASIEVTHKTSLGAVSSAYTVTKIHGGPVSRCEGCDLISGNDVDYDRDDSLILVGFASDEET